MTDPTPPTPPALRDRLELGVEDLHVPEPSADAEALLLKLGLILPVVGVVLILAGLVERGGHQVRGRPDARC
jgi:hypothetical protein